MAPGWAEVRTALLPLCQPAWATQLSHSPCSQPAQPLPPRVPTIAAQPAGLDTQGLSEDEQVSKLSLKQPVFEWKKKKNNMSGEVMEPSVLTGVGLAQWFRLLRLPRFQSQQGQRKKKGLA